MPIWIVSKCGARDGWSPTISGSGRGIRLFRSSTIWPPAGCCRDRVEVLHPVQTEVEVRNLTDYDSALGLLTSADHGAA